jgi:hypothetical protein
MSNPLEVTITLKNAYSVLSAGKKAPSSATDFSVLSLLYNKEQELNIIKSKESIFHPTTTEQRSNIQSLIEDLRKYVAMLELPLHNLAEAKYEWELKAYPLFMKACYTSRRIVVAPNGISITVADKENHQLAGVYPSAKDVEICSDTTGLASDIANGLISEAEAVATVWRKYLGASQEAWQLAANIVGGQSAQMSSSLETIIKDAKERINAAEHELQLAQEYKNFKRELDSVTTDVETLRKQYDKLSDEVSSIDPILTSFGTQNAKVTYDSKWIDTVREVAERRETMPFLPILSGGAQSNMVFNWQAAINSGKPNLCIEADTDEGLEGKMDMLDNFLATMLLAFPVRQVHITVLEYRTVNQFISNLPYKICQRYDIAKDTEAIDLLVQNLRQMYSEGRDNKLPDCCPREIVVIAGFDKGDKKFSERMEELKDIIRNGKRAGIYFALVLTEDATKYDWKGKDAAANDFMQYFAAYSTIMTEQQDYVGNGLPDYDLLHRKALIPADSGEVSGTLAKLITDYITKGAATIPNKVYDLIANGQLYSSVPIRNLDDQPKADVGKIVAPIAQTENGELINLRFDDESYISCFILGRSGMGKSFTLHTILTNLMLKYDSSAIEFILMDFKPGGVELNYYKDVPHVSKLLVNGADEQVAEEILSSLIKEMDYRGEIFHKCNQTSIGRYNTYASSHGLEQMKHIILLVDECQNMFSGANENSVVNIVTRIAKEGRSFGVHMVFATQTLQSIHSLKDALAQFRDFLFMGCGSDDVSACEITDKDVQQRVGQLVKGEVIYYHRGAEPMHGYVFNYYGKNGEYGKKTHENLLSSRFTRANKSQFYFDASQIYQLDEQELHSIYAVAKAGPISTALLGKNLSVKGDSLYAKFGNEEGANLLILGDNSIQSERVLWNAVVSLYKCNDALQKEARYYILANIPEYVDQAAKETHQRRMDMLSTLDTYQGVTIAEGKERFDTIERVAATVRGRKATIETDCQAVYDFDSIYLVIPNQQLIYSKMFNQPRGLNSLDSDLTIPGQEEPEITEQAATDVETDDLGFESLNAPASPFIALDTTCFETNASRPVETLSLDKPGKNLDEELRYILRFGPEVGVHVLLHSTAPDKIYAADTMYKSEMDNRFNDRVFLKIQQSERMSLPIADKIVQNLSSDSKSLRAVAYNSVSGAHTIIPFDIPNLQTI